MSEIKECFISRFEGGVLLESDFSQLEVVGLAALSNDPVLIEDLLSGRDMHTHFTAERLGITQEEAKALPNFKYLRFVTKRMTFQLQYGSGAPNMARKLGIAKEEAERFIQEYYTRYSRVKDWQAEVYEAVERSRKSSERRAASGEPLGRGVYESVSGRLYTFFEMEAPEWKRDKTPSFMPTQVKNYPVQGFATGDIMALFRARLYRWWLALEDDLRLKILPINTVHDSVMFDVENLELAAWVANEMEMLADTLIDEVEELWGIRCPVPFKIESKAGPSWADMKTL